MGEGISKAVPACPMGRLLRISPDVPISKTFHFGELLPHRSYYAPFWFFFLLLIQLARPVSMVPNIPGIPGPPVNSSGSISPSGHPMPSEAKMVSTSQPEAMLALLKEVVFQASQAKEPSGSSKAKDTLL